MSNYHIEWKFVEPELDTDQYVRADPSNSTTDQSLGAFLNRAPPWLDLWHGPQWPSTMDADPITSPTRPGFALHEASSQVRTRKESSNPCGSEEGTLQVEPTTPTLLNPFPPLISTLLSLSLPHNFPSTLSLSLSICPCFYMSSPLPFTFSSVPHF